MSWYPDVIMTLIILFMNNVPRCAPPDLQSALDGHRSCTIVFCAKCRTFGYFDAQSRRSTFQVQISVLRSVLPNFSRRPYIHTYNPSTSCSE